MPKQYKYTLLKQDGSIKELGVSVQKSLKEIYKILNCTIIQLVPSVYYKGHGKCHMYCDEEGKLADIPKPRNPHFKVLKDFDGSEWDIIGDVLKEKLEARV